MTNEELLKPKQIKALANLFVSKMIAASEVMISFPDLPYEDVVKLEKELARLSAKHYTGFQNCHSYDTKKLIEYVKNYIK